VKTNSESGEDEKMERMRKISVCIIILIMIFSLIGCGSSKNAVSTDTNTTANAVPQEADQSKTTGTTVAFLIYNNARFGFSLSCPDIYTIKMESDNGDGITMKNEDKRYALKIWGANNVNHDTGTSLLAAAKNRVSHIINESADDKVYKIEYNGGDEPPLIFDEIGCVVGDQVRGFILSYPEKEKESFKDIVTKMSAELTKNTTASTTVTNNDAKISTTDNSGLTLTTSVGKMVAITLDENITTGYSWHYVIENADLIKFDSENTVENDSRPGIVGAGSKHTWNFKGIKPGTSKITFKYYRSWETEKSAVNTVEYTIRIME
jgi:Predicted secreted protein